MVRITVGRLALGLLEGAYRLIGVGVEFVRGNEVLWLGMSRPQWFLLVVLPLLLWRTLRVFGKALRPKLEENAA